ncbi:MAG: inositol monophosphatase family protein [Planctomycetota bacterium]|jgi:myo-inositol-1(or 4)-monophosphatase
MYEFLKQISLEAGNIALAHKARLADVRITRKSAKDLVTEADVAVENYLVEQIKQTYPDHAIVGEETGTHAGTAYRWIIDPIDGTTSFVHDQPFFAISIGLEKDGELHMAAVNAPVLGELFMAERGKGATLNGKPIGVSQRDILSDCVLGTGFACVRSDLEHNNLPYFNAVLPQIRGIRRYGSAAIDLCYTACGRMEGFWELNLKIYDIAAGMLICTEAGGTVTDFSGKTDNLPHEVLATNTKIHNQLSEILTKTKQLITQSEPPS